LADRRRLDGAQRWCADHAKEEHSSQPKQRREHVNRDDGIIDL
jgi:hypothetical protein